MSNHNLRVSVIIPTHNRAKVLPRAVDSALKQDYENIEIIVVDDASTDETPQKIEDYEKDIEYIRFEQNRGANAARNAGIRYSTGDIISFLDSDDEYPSDNISKKVDALKSAPDSCGGVFTPHKTYKNGQIWRTGMYSGSTVDIDVLKHSNVVGGFSCVAVRRSVFNDVGFLDESLPSSQDYDFYLRLTQEYILNYIDSTHVNRYADSDRIGFDTQRKVEGHLKILEKYPDLLSPKRRARQYSSLGILFARSGESKSTKTYLLKSIYEDMTEWRAYPLLALASLGDKPLQFGMQCIDRAISIISKCQ